MEPLFEAIVDHVPSPPVEVEGPLQLQVSSLDYSSYVGLLGIGRVSRGVVKRNMPVTLVQRDGTERNAQLMELYGFEGLERKSIPEAGAGDIVVFSGIDGLKISDTVCARGQGAGLPPLQVDEPTITMTFQVNKSPFAGKEGKYLTSRQIRARLEQELMHNVALRVEDTEDPDKFRVSGRGELHLSVLIENMRREGLRARRVAPGGHREDGRRRRAGAVGAADGRLRGAIPGRRDDAARRAQGRAEDDDARRPRPRATRVSDSGARPDRLPHRVPHGHGGHRDSSTTSSTATGRAQAEPSASASTARWCRW